MGTEDNRPTNPGWYDDPAGEKAYQAYWDGERWTGATRRPQTRPESSPWPKRIGLALLVYFMLTLAADFIWSLLGWPEPQPPVYLAALAIGIGVTWYMSRSGRLGRFPVGRIWLIILALVILALVGLIAIYYVFIRPEL